MSLYPFNLRVPSRGEKTTGIPRNHTTHWATLQGCCFMQLICSHGRTTSMSMLFMIRNWKKTLFFLTLRSIIAWEKLLLGAHLESPDAPVKDTETHTELKPTSDTVPWSPKRETPAFVTFESSAKHLLWYCKGSDSDLSGTGGDLKHLLFSHSAQATLWVWQYWAKGEKVRQLQYLRGHGGDSSI